MVVPYDAILMEISSRVEPQPKLLLSTRGCSIPIHVGLQNPTFVVLVPQQLKVDLVVVVWVHIRIRQLKFPKTKLSYGLD